MRLYEAGVLVGVRCFIEKIRYVQDFTFSQIVSILKLTFIGKLMTPVNNCDCIPT